MINEPELPPNIIPFPTQLRVVVALADPSERPGPATDDAASVVEHDGRAYDLAALVRHLSPAELREIGQAVPRSGQELWDEVVRRWPALAAEIVAGVGALSG